MVCSLLARKARKTSRTFAYFYGDARFGSIWNRKESLNSKYRDLCLSMAETVTGADLQVISTEVSSAGQRVWRLAKSGMTTQKYRQSSPKKMPSSRAYLRCREPSESIACFA